MSFAVEPLAIAEVKLVRGMRRTDGRGWFAETYRRDRFADLGIGAEFVQDNHSTSFAAGTLRGLHFQAPPFAQAKLIRVIRGAIFDVVVDLRRSAPSFGKWVGVRLDEERADQLYVPRGFAHGFCTEAPDTQVAYKCDAYYAAGSERGIRFSDPDLGIAWPREPAVVLERDRQWPLFRDIDSPFD